MPNPCTRGYWKKISLNGYTGFYVDYHNLICTHERYTEARCKKGAEYFDELEKSGYLTGNYKLVANNIYKQLGCK